MKKFFRKLKIRDYVTAILLVLFLVCLAIGSKISGTLGSMGAAEAWQGESNMRFSQIACFFPENGTVNKEQVLAFRATLDTKLLENSMEADEDTVLYADAYSAESLMNVSVGKGTSRVNVIGVGGDFFLFHPLYLRSGGYVSEKDLMQDRVVLDEDVAWMLFGSSNVAGMTVTVNGRELVVAGVISRESDFATKQAYTAGPGMFMCWDTFHALTEKGANCYEIVLPDPVAGFGKTLVEENFPAEAASCVENSSRYSVKNLMDVAANFGKRSMRNDGVIFPYWENAVRLTEDYLALIMVVMALLIIFPLVRGIVFVIRTIIRTYRKAKKKIPEEIEKRVEQRKEQQYEKAGAR